MDDTCVIQPSKGVRSYALEIPARRNFTLSSSSPPVNNGLTPSVLVGHGGQVVSDSWQQGGKWCMVVYGGEWCIIILIDVVGVQEFL